MTPQALPIMTIHDVTASLLQPRIEAALRRRVGLGKLVSRERLAEYLGVNIRTVDGWLNDFRMPPLDLWFRLVGYFGPDFENEIRTGLPSNTRVVTMAEIDAINAALALAAQKIAAITDRFDRGAEIIPMNKERA